MAKYYGLPVNHSERDSEWINNQLSQLNAQHKTQAVRAYSDCYIIAYNAEQTPYKKENKARREANIKLRVFVSKCVDRYNQQKQKMTNQFQGF